MPDSQKTRYEIEHLFPGFDQQEFWDLFVDNDGWTKSDILPGRISIVEPGEGHPQGKGAVRSVRSSPDTRGDSTRVPGNRMDPQARLPLGAEVRLSRAGT